MITTHVRKNKTNTQNLPITNKSKQKLIKTDNWSALGSRLIISSLLLPGTVG